MRIFSVKTCTGRLARNGWVAFALVLFFFACRPKGGSQDDVVLYVIHAGSLTVPVKDMVEAFEKENSGVNIRTEAWGSKAGARRVIDLENQADVFMSADYMVIKNMLIPDYASWYIPFARNEMAIVYTGQSAYATQVDDKNWMDILLQPDVAYGRSNPDHDPCGVRSVFTIELAGLMHERPGFADSLLAKDTRYIRPKETDLIALLESGHLDFIFLYRSVAEQHGLKYVQLPDSLSLGNDALNDWYGHVGLVTLGSKPGETIYEYGEAMVYGLTIPHKSPHPDWAVCFVDFVCDPDKGGVIMRKHGQLPLPDPQPVNPIPDDSPEP